MSNYKSVISKIGNETVCLLNADQEIVFRIEPGQEFWYARDKGGREYRMHHSTDIARETLLQANQISQEEYENY